MTQSTIGLVTVQHRYVVGLVWLVMHDSIDYVLLLFFWFILQEQVGYDADCRIGLVLIFNVGLSMSNSLSIWNRHNFMFNK